MIEQEIFAIQQDLSNQETFVNTIIALINQIGIAKRDTSVTDLEIGFKLGEVFRLLHEFSADSTRLRNEIEMILIKLTAEKNEQQPNKILFD